MATIIDALLVTLGLESSGFEKGRAKVDDGLKKTKKSADDANKSVGEVAKTFVKFLAVVGGTVAIKRFAEHLIESSAALDRLSKNIGVSADTISAWSNAAELVGGSASGLQGTMDMLSKSQTDLMLTGESGLVPYFSALVMSLADAQGKARPVTDILLELADRFSKMDRTTANNMGRSMGIDQGTMQLLLKGRSEVELTIKRQKEYGAVTKQQAEESSRLQRAMIASKQSFEAFGRELLSQATPALEKLFSIFSGFGDWIRNNQEFVSDFLKILGIGLGVFIAATTPINLVVITVLALAAAFAGLWQDYQTWARGGKSLFDWTLFVKGISLARDAVTGLRDVLMDAGFRLAAFLTMTAKFYSGDRKGAKAAADAMVKGMKQSLAEDIAANPPKKPAEGMSAQEYFISQGWTPAQAAGIAANLERESGMNPAAIGDNGKAYGIGQWHPDRQANFAKWAGKPIEGSTREEQMAFVHYELTSGGEQGAGAELRRAITAKRAGEIVSKMYERPADKEGEAAIRGGLARSMFLGIPGASQAAAGSGAGGGVPMMAGNRSSETNIGEIKVYTAATDAPGIAKDMGKSMEYLFTSQVNGGLF